jgi:hypothetical protein
LLAKRDCSLAEGDEVAEDRPEVAGVGGAELLARRAERLARTRAGADGSIDWPSCEFESVGPAADTGEEMVLSVSSEFMRRYFEDTTFVHVASRYLACAD